MNYIALDLTDLLTAAALVLANGGVSMWLSLQLERQLFIAAARMVVQLAIMGLVLKVIFQSASLTFTLAAFAVMALFAGYEIMNRQERRLQGVWSYGVGSASILFSVTLVTAFALGTQVQPDPWYDPRYAIPFFGMILGNTMTGVSLGLNTLTTQVHRERMPIEARLALGQPFSLAAQTVVRGAVKTGFVPIINSMSAVGLVFLPGMMTGQILAGVAPIEAVKYQMLIMFLIAGGTGLGVIIAVHLGAYRLTDSRHRLRLDRLAEGDNGGD